jgi:actin related protein 2/3 complex subunit 1A/1B
MSALAAEPKRPEMLNPDGVPCFCFNADKTQIALSPNCKDVLIYDVTGQQAGSWKLKHILREHDSFVSGIDWSHATGNLVTCGHDRNAYVWQYNKQKNEWKPTLVILRINRAATNVRWTPDGKKFAVSSAAKVVPVCHYESTNDWWISKMIKHHKSTVLDLAWHANNKLLVTGCADRKCRIFSGFIEEVDSKDDAQAFAATFPKQFDFGACVAEFDNAHAWVNSVAWSPSGYRLAFAGHDSSVHFVQILGGGAPPEVKSVMLRGLPATAITFMNDNTLVSVSWDCSPHLFTASGSEAEPVWTYAKALDNLQSGSTAAAAVAPDRQQSKFGAAYTKFEDGASRGADISKSGVGQAALPAIVLNTKHQNAILALRQIDAKRFVTSGADGCFYYWSV